MVSDVEREHTETVRKQATVRTHSRGWLLGGVILGILIGVVGMLLLQLAMVRPPAPVKPALADTNAPLTLTMNDAAVTQLVTTSLATNTVVPIKNVVAEIRPGDQIAFAGNVSTFGITQPFDALGQLSLNNGALALHLTQANIAGVPVPGPLTSALENSFNSQLAKSTQSLVAGGQYRITGITTAEHRLTLSLAEK